MREKFKAIGRVLGVAALSFGLAAVGILWMGKVEQAKRLAEMEVRCPVARERLTTVTDQRLVAPLRFEVQECERFGV